MLLVVERSPVRVVHTHTHYLHCGRFAVADRGVFAVELHTVQSSAPVPP
jgi:hypothetical protein